MGWPSFQSSNDRPKSATATSNTGNNHGNGAQGNILMTSLTGGGRPTSSNQMTGGMNNWGAQAHTGGDKAHTGRDAGSAANSNAYSYGSLKNRFLSAGGTNSKAGYQSNHGTSTQRHGSSNKSSKLFSLARWISAIADESKCKSNRPFLVSGYDTQTTLAGYWEIRFTFATHSY